MIKRSDDVPCLLLYRSVQDFTAHEQLQHAMYRFDTAASNADERKILEASSSALYPSPLQDLNQLKRRVAEISAADSPQTPDSCPNGSFPSQMDSAAVAIGLDQNISVNTEDEGNTCEGNDVSNTDQTATEVNVLYQKYHVVIAVDFGRSSFEVARNGAVFVDRVPGIIENVTDTIRATIQSRRQECADMKAYYSHLPQSVKDGMPNIDQLLWNPEVLISMALLNAPRWQVSGSTARATHSVSEEDEDDFLLPTDVSMLGSTETTSESAIIPLFVRNSAEVVLQDRTLMQKITERLYAYERLFREAEARNVSDNVSPSSISHAIESLCNCVPLDATECHSIVIVSNFAVHGCSESVMLLNHQILRKGIVITLISLNQFLVWDSAHLSSLRTFVDTSGGSVFHFGVCEILAKSKGNDDWCRSLAADVESLARVLFVRRLVNPPIARSVIPRSTPTLTEFALTEVTDAIVTPNVKHCYIQALATSRLNEGWNVVVDRGCNWAVATMRCRSPRGHLEVVYEAHYNEPALYRRLFVSGSSHQVQAFLSFRPNAKEVKRVAASANWSNRAEFGSTEQLFLSLTTHTLISRMKSESLFFRLCDVVANITDEERCAARKLAPSLVPVLHCVASLCTATHLDDAWISRFRVVSTLGRITKQNVSHFIFGPIADDSLRRTVVSLLKGLSDWLIMKETADDNTILLVYNSRALKSGMCLLQVLMHHQTQCVCMALEFRFSFTFDAENDNTVIQDTWHALNGAALDDNILWMASMEDPIEQVSLAIAKLTHHPQAVSSITDLSDGTASSSSASNTTSSRAALLQKKHASTAGDWVARSEPQQYTLLALKPTAVVRWTFVMQECTGEHKRCVIVPLLLLCRVRDGFTVLHASDREIISRLVFECSAGSKAVLHETIWVEHTARRIDVFVRRHITSLSSNVAPLRPQSLVEVNRGLRRDMNLLSVLLTAVQLTANVPLFADADSLDDAGLARGTTINVPTNIEGIVGGLTVNGSGGDVSEGGCFSIAKFTAVAQGLTAQAELGRSVHHFVSMMGDERCECAPTIFSSDLRQLVAWSDKDDISISVTRARKHSASHGCMSMFISSAVPEGNGGVSSVAGKPTVDVMHATFDMASILRSLIKSIVGGGTTTTLAPPFDVSEFCDVSSATHGLHNRLARDTLSCLESFVSLVQAKIIHRQMLDRVTRQLRQPSDNSNSVPGSDAPDGEWMQQLRDAFKDMVDYHVDIDITHLMLMVQTKLGTPGSAAATFAECKMVLSKLVVTHLFALMPPVDASASLYLLDTASAAWFDDSPQTSSGPMTPSIGPRVPSAFDSDTDTDRDDEAVFLGDGGPDSFPALVRFALLQKPPASKGDLTEAGWVGGSKRLPHVGSNSQLIHWPTQEVADAQIEKEIVIDASAKLILRVVLRSVSAEHVAVCKNHMRPKSTEIHSWMYHHVAVSHASATQRKSSLMFFDENLAISDFQELAKQMTDVAGLPESFQLVADRVISILSDKVAAYSLDKVRNTSSAVKIFTLSSCAPSTIPDSSLNSQSLREPLPGASALSFLVRPVVPADDMTAFISLATRVVYPAFQSCPKLLIDTFSVQFSLSVLDVKMDDMATVFSQCLEEDGLFTIPLPLVKSIIVVPRNEKTLASIILVQLCSSDNQPDGLIELVKCWAWSQHNKVESRDAIAEVMRRLISEKVTQLSQQVLYQVMRQSCYAPEDLIPERWGAQFPQLKSVSSSSLAKLQQPPLSTSGAFHCEGCTVMTVPLHFKQQNQARKLMNLIARHHQELNLIAIFDREQCYMLADDDTDSLFHHIRLVLVPENMSPESVLTSAPPPQLSGRAHYLLVQLYSSRVRMAKVQLKLNRIADFLYFSAVNEILNHLSFVGTSSINAEDLSFLQYECIQVIESSLHQMSRQSSMSLETLNSIETPPMCSPAESFVGDGLGAWSEESRLMAELCVRVNFAHRGFKELHAGGESTPVSAQPFYACHPKKGEPPHTRPAEDAADQKSILYIKTSHDASTIDTIDAVVSCTVAITDSGRLTLRVFRTRLPAERRSTSYDREAFSALQACLRQVTTEIEFTQAIFGSHIAPVVSKRVTIEEAAAVAAHLLDTTLGMDGSPVLARTQLSTEGLGPSLVGTLLHRLTGVLEPFKPTVLQVSRYGSVEMWRNFSWRRLEGVQTQVANNNSSQFFIFCGFNLFEDLNTGDGDVLPMATRVQRVTHPTVSFSTALLLPAALQAAGTRRRNTSTTTNASVNDILSTFRIVVRISVVDGLQAVFFNVRDAEQLVYLTTDVLDQLVTKSGVLSTILLQNLGFSVPLALSERCLAEYCCGELSAVTERATDISQEVFGRNVSSLRCHISCSDPLNTIIHGLYNRGLIVNFIFPADGAIKILFDESETLTYDACIQTFQSLVQSGCFVKEVDQPFGLWVRHGSGAHHAHTVNTSGVFRIVETSHLPQETLIANDYHRHLQVAHTMVEAKNGRNRITEVMMEFREAWAHRDHRKSDILPLVIQLQQMCKQVYGSRVPEFSLRDLSAKPTDQILSQTFPKVHRQGQELCRSVDRVLSSFMQHLSQCFPSIFVIDVDPNVNRNQMHDLVKSRLVCRYGKIVSGDRTIEFSPHLFFVIIPISKILEDGDAGGGSSEDVVDSGLFILEVGFQVVNYALDFFVLNGSVRSSAEISSKVRAFKQRLTFSSVLYDLCVSRLLACLRCHSATLPGEQPLSVALANLMKFYPVPPNYSYSCAQMYVISDPRIQGMRRSQSSGEEDNLVTFVVPDEVDAQLLVRSKTGARYQYVGLTVWEDHRVVMYVVCGPTDPPDAKDKTTRSTSADLASLAELAFSNLKGQMLDSSLHQRAENAWSQVWERQTLSTDEFDLITKSCSKLALSEQCRRLQECDANTVGIKWSETLRTFHQRSNRASDTPIHFVSESDNVVGMSSISSNSAASRLVVTVAMNTFRNVFTYLLINLARNEIQEFVLCRSVAGPTMSSVGLLSEEESRLVDVSMRFVASAIWSVIEL